MEFSISCNNDRIVVKSPFNTKFVEGARLLGGKWDQSEKVWTFNPINEQNVRDLCFDIYGTDGIRDDRVTVMLTAKSLLAATRDSIRVHGRILATAHGRDSGAKWSTDPDVELIYGSASSGGSVKNWDTRIQPGTKIMIHNFPRSKAEKMQAESKNWEVQIMETAATTEPAAEPTELEKFSKWLQDMGFITNSVDPIILVKQYQNGVA